jgi:hypothetical protein
MGFHLVSPFTKTGKAVHITHVNSAIDKGFEPYTEATLMPLRNWQALEDFWSLWLDV